MKTELFPKRAVVETVGNSLLLSNYGSFLQHYALRWWLKERGISTQRGLDFGERAGAFSFLWSFFRIRVYYRFLAICGKLGNHTLRSYNSTLIRFRVEKKFRSCYRRYIGPICEKPWPREHIVAIVGSDQVWWNSCSKNWLAGYDASCPKIAYAASADWTRCGDDNVWKRDAVNELSKFSGVSVRENAGVRLLLSLNSTLSIARVADPVMLAGRDALDVVKSNKQVLRRRTLLVYLVNIKDSAMMALNRLTALAQQLNVDLKVIDAQLIGKFVPKSMLVCPDPSGFLRAIEDAEYVVTNSFHGTVLAILYKKAFLSVRQPVVSGRDQNCRQKELLTALELDERGVVLSDVEAARRILRTTINWDDIMRKVDDFRTASALWFEAALVQAKKELPV